MCMNKFLTVFFLTSLITIQAQSSEKINQRSVRNFGYGFQLLGPTLGASFYLDYFINHNVNIEGGAGLIGFYGGAKIYGGKKEKKQLFSPYFGLNVGMISLPDINMGWYGGSSSGWNKLASVYVPVGIQLMNKNGFHFSVEGAYFFYGSSSFSRSIPYGSIRLGKNFQKNN